MFGEPRECERRVAYAVIPVPVLLRLRGDDGEVRLSAPDCLFEKCFSYSSFFLIFPLLDFVGIVLVFLAFCEALLLVISMSGGYGEGARIKRGCCLRAVQN